MMTKIGAGMKGDFGIMSSGRDYGAARSRHPINHQRNNSCRAQFLFPSHSILIIFSLNHCLSYFTRSSCHRRLENHGLLLSGKERKKKLGSWLGACWVIHLNFKKGEDEKRLNFVCVFIWLGLRDTSHHFYMGMNREVEQGLLGLLLRPQLVINLPFVLTNECCASPWAMRAKIRLV